VGSNPIVSTRNSTLHAGFVRPHPRRDSQKVSSATVYYWGVGEIVPASLRDGGSDRELI
jgi:hypothetical protein